MILEMAVLNVVPGQEADFEAAFGRAKRLIAPMKGFGSLQLQRCVEHRSRYLLLVQWEALEDHTVGFRVRPSIRSGSHCCITSTIPSRALIISKRCFTRKARGNIMSSRVR